MRWTRPLTVIAVTGALTIASSSASAAPVLEGGDVIRLRTPSSDLGPHPILRWTAQPGADHYLVVVQTPTGAPYWTWQGAETRVRFGGGPLDAREQSAGARLERKKVWFVIAYDAGDAVVASSEKRALSP